MQTNDKLLSTHFQIKEVFFTNERAQISKRYHLMRNDLIVISFRIYWQWLPRKHRGDLTSHKKSRRRRFFCVLSPLLAGSACPSLSSYLTHLHPSSCAMANRRIVLRQVDANPVDLFKVTILRTADESASRLFDVGATDRYLFCDRVLQASAKLTGQQLCLLFSIRTVSDRLKVNFWWWNFDTNYGLYYFDNKVSQLYFFALW